MGRRAVHTEPLAPANPSCLTTGSCVARHLLDPDSLLVTEGHLVPSSASCVEAGGSRDGDGRVSGDDRTQAWGPGGWVQLPFYSCLSVSTALAVLGRTPEPHLRRVTGVSGVLDTQTPHLQGPVYGIGWNCGQQCNTWDTSYSTPVFALVRL